MRTIDLHGYSSHSIGALCEITLLAQYYQQEFGWVLNHAREQKPEANALYIGSYVLLLNPAENALYNGAQCDTKDETMAFILNETLRLKAEAKEVNALFKLASRTCEEPRYRKVSMFHLMGLQQNMGSPLLDKDVVKVMEFQRANQKTLTKMKEACVRALLRGIQPPFVFNDDMDLSDNKRTYKSIFD
ncbi:hypothetical protein SBP1_gp035 [Vibrio virus vB_VspP_SBP1]|uniref:Uncharacterized protein n=1 Tax=Vibrio virus vB_VspP_SBP1 TaxID=2500581 RepID=A0A3T0IIG9_9CAUD|nr:hypothetical protein KNU36_gp094 [Vibrio virus vB_VspP_SBP1]AZU99627.1 hypothetical protein SBP1_gp035 [Vibrio virus vB_VspP_SBP1]